MPKIAYIHFDVEKDDVRSLTEESFLLITCKLVFAFIRDKNAFLQKVSQLLPVGGAFVVISPTYTNTADATPISVQRDDTVDLIRTYFNNVIHFELEGLRYFVAR